MFAVIANRYVCEVFQSPSTEVNNSITIQRADLNKT